MSSWDRAGVAMYLSVAGWCVSCTGAMTASAQMSDSPLPEAPLVAMAWDAGCLNAQECARLSEAMERSGASVWTQQAVAAELAPARVDVVIPCLAAILEWRQAFAHAITVPERQDGGGMSFRMDTRSMEEGKARVQGRFTGRLRHPDGLDMGFRTSFGTEGLEATTGFVHGTRARTDWWIGTVTGRFGQGLVQWTPGAFDDLGGMEGSHRIGAGIRPTGWRGRGVLDGVAFRRQPAATGSRVRPNWVLLGRMWPDGLWSASFGHENRHGGWLVRLLEFKAGPWSAVAGMHSGGQKGGWSWRWGLAGFRRGWEGRLSLLRSWSRHFEGHALLRREHPDHPRWSTGEMRATPLDAGTLPGMEFTGGIAFSGLYRGWVRLGLRWSGPPPFRLRRTSAVRLERGAVRMQFRTTRVVDARGQSPSHGIVVAPAWSWECRRQDRLPLPADGTWRAHLVVAGSQDGLGAAWALVLGWKGAQGRAIRMGLAQTWGPAGAPARYVQGWDGRPAVALSGTSSRGYFRWQSSNGAWRCGIQWLLKADRQHERPLATSTGINAVRVEFRPHRISRRWR